MVTPASAQAVLDERKKGVNLLSRSADAVNLFDPQFLLASLIWGSIGLGYWIYGKRQRSWVPMVGGVLMMVVSYFVGSALLMSLICAALIAGVYVLLREGY
jgi:hypothetical protein